MPTPSFDQDQYAIFRQMIHAREYSLDYLAGIDPRVRLGWAMDQVCAGLAQMDANPQLIKEMREQFMTDYNLDL